MKDIQVYNNPDFGDIRSILINNEPWFVGKDVADILGYAKPLNALSQHVDIDDSLKQGLTDSMGRIQETILINESGLYSLILSSKLPSAKKFKKWVTSEVLPSIRKTGTFVNRDNLSPELQMIYAMVDNQAKIEIAQKKNEEQIAALDVKVSAIQCIMTESLGDWKADINRRVREIAIKSHIDYKAVYNEMYGELETKAHCSLKRLQDNKRSRMEKAGNTKTAIDEATTKIAIIHDKPQLKDIFENIVKKWAMRYCV